MDSLAFETLLIKNQQDFAPVVPFDPVKEKMISFDLSPFNEDMTEEIFGSMESFMAYVNNKLMTGNARYGVGGYNEYRAIYGRSRVFDSRDNDVEPRRLHLGTDIWGQPHTPVMAPMDGIIHSFAFNNQFGDYGVAILLTHMLDGTSFHTLYGHLSLNSIKNVQEGTRIRRGDVMAEFGIPLENGHWPPHLHFQIIKDIGNWKGDYPGVCKFSEKEYYLSNCPDPDLILRFNQYL